MEDLRALTSVAFRDDWWILLLPAACIAIDILTGVLHAWIKNGLKSYRLREGLAKKAGELLAIILGEVLVAGLCIPKIIVSGISAYITFMEVISIMENFHKLGIPIPPTVAKALGVMNETLNGKKSDELSEETKKNIKKIKNSISNKKIKKKGETNDAK
jgi:toxin secretion/phage lysis holin